MIGIKRDREEDGETCQRYGDAKVCDLASNSGQIETDIDFH